MLESLTDPRALKTLPQSLESMIEATPIYSDLAERSASGSNTTPQLLTPAPLGQVETIMKLRTVDDSEAAAWLQALNKSMARVLGGEVSAGTPPLLLPSARLSPAAAAHFSDSESTDSDESTTNGGGGTAVASATNGARAIEPPARRGQRVRSAARAGGRRGSREPQSVPQSVPQQEQDEVNEAASPGSELQSESMEDAATPAALVATASVASYAPPRLVALAAVNFFAVLVAFSRSGEVGAWGNSRCGALAEGELIKIYRGHCVRILLTL